MGNYSFLQDFCSLLEVFTAAYVSMFIDNILSDIWTPNYKKKISTLIENMNIPAIRYFVKKVEGNIDGYSGRLIRYMKKRAMFYVLFCMSLLLLAGIEHDSLVLSKYGYLMVAILSGITFSLNFVEGLVYRSLASVTITACIYIIVFVVLYFSDFLHFIYGIGPFYNIGYKFATCSFLIALSVPIIRQLFIVWVYSRLYKGYMQEKISREAYVYGKAFIAYKLKDMAALPKEYEMVARDFVATPSGEEDTSLNSLNKIIVKRLEKLCEPPNVLKVFWSWIKYNCRGRRNPEAEYIEQNGLDYGTIQPIIDNGEELIPEQGQDEGELEQDQ